LPSLDILKISDENQGVYFMWHDDKIMSDQSRNKYKYILCIYSL
jgi:hypothetical protein